jgi:hypothetical protein
VVALGAFVAVCGKALGRRDLLADSRSAPILNGPSVAMCRLTTVGKKVIERAINREDVLKGTLIPKLVKHLPVIMPIAIE